MRAHYYTFLAVFVVLFAACGDDDSSGTDGGGRVDGGRADGGGRDGGGVVDGGATDSGGTDGAVATDAGAIDTCTVPSDCAWGEIDHEILTPSDCLCLFGCPSIVMNVTVRDRRQAAYDAMCTPGIDGMGNPCPVDDCIAPPPLDCVSNLCVAVADGGA